MRIGGLKVLGRARSPALLGLALMVLGFLPLRARAQEETLPPTQAPSPSPTPTPTTVTPPTQAPPPSPTASATPTPTPHRKNPIDDPWPKLTKVDLKGVRALIDAGKNADALAELVKVMKTRCCSFDTMAGSEPVYAPDLEAKKGKGVGGNTERKKGGIVRIGPAAFKGYLGTEPEAFLYSTLKHEMVHSMQLQDPKGAAEKGNRRLEFEAYGAEIINSINTGISSEYQTWLEKLVMTLK